MSRRDKVGSEFRSAAEAYGALRSRAQQAISRGDRQGVDVRALRVMLRDEAGNLLFKGTVQEAAHLQFGSDAPLGVSREPTMELSTDRTSLSEGFFDRRRRPVVAHRLETRLAALLKARTTDSEISGTTRRHLEALLFEEADIFYRMSSDWSKLCTLSGNGFIVDTRNPRRDWLRTYIPAGDRSFVMDRVQLSIRTKDIFNLRHRVIRADGRVGWTQSRAVPVLDSKGVVLEWFGSADEITAMREYEKGL